jgi:RND family efflux transporter MFP subunit
MLRVLFVVLAGVLFMACGKGETGEVKTEKVLPIVKVNNVEPVSFTETYNLVGVVKPYETATIAAEEGGLIIFLRKEKGDRVGRGETVVRLNKQTDYASYEQSLSQLELARSNFERTSRLYEERVITEQEFTNARLNLDIAERSVDVFESRLRSGSVRSPISGIVNQKFMDRGEVTGPGTPILEVVDVSRVKVSTGIPERYLNDVTKGSKVRITFDVLPGEEFEGTVSFVSPTISEANRTFEIEVVISNPDGKLKPEMSANIQVTKLNIPDAVVLQQDMIVDYGEEKFVFVLDETNRARKRVLTLGGRNGNSVLIESGLSPGDKLIIEGYQSLVDGDEVQVIAG